MLVTNVHNVTYLTGFTGEASYLWINGEKETLVSDGRFSEQIEEECPGLDVVIRKPFIPIMTAAAKVVAASKVTSLLVEGEDLSYIALSSLEKQLPKLTLVPVAGIVESLRSCKDNDELKSIQRAISFAESAFLNLRANLHADWTEMEVANELEYFIRKAGGTRSAFQTIVGVGPRAALPHAVPSEKRVSESPFVLIDWGAREHLYVSDLTRVLVTGNLPPKFDRIYHTVLAAQQAAINAIRPGVLCSQVDAIARSVIEAAGFGKRFTHGLGHGIGLQIHEGIRMARGQDVELKKGMIITVEPGIYIPNWGGVRIEDDILVTKDGHRVLTSLPRELEANIVKLH